jgi:hypothetical protein
VPWQFQCLLQCAVSWPRLKIADVNSQNNIYRSTENPNAVHEVSWRSLKDGVWCAISARRILEPESFHEKKFQTLCEVHSVTLLRSIDWWRIVWALAANNLMDALNEVFGERVVSQGFWPPWSPYLILVTLIYEAHRNKKCMRAIRSVRKNFNKIKHEMFAICVQQLRPVPGNIFLRCQACVEAECRHFKTFLYNKIKYSGRADRELPSIAAGVCGKNTLSAAGTSPRTNCTFCI